MSISTLSRLNEEDKKFETNVIERRANIERIVLTLSIIFICHTVGSFILLKNKWVNDYFISSNSFNFFAFMYIENIVFGIVMVYLFNKYKF